MDSNERIKVVGANIQEKAAVIWNVANSLFGAYKPHEYGGFDRVAVAAVRRMKQKYPDITLMLVLPYHPAERPTEAPDGFDGTYHPDGLETTPKRYAIVRANKIMVDASDWLVCYVRHGAGNSWKLLEYAQRRAAKGLIQIENIGENESGK